MMGTKVNIFIENLFEKSLTFVDFGKFFSVNLLFDFC